MKKIIGLCLALLLAVSLAACGKKDRVLYNDVRLSKIVELGAYKGVEVDTSSDEFKEFYENVLSEDVENGDLYVKKTEGKVADGDTVNIDYEGKRDGVAFDGGTDTGYDLVIGSDSFIDGFEDGLIGVAIGDTVDLNLKFPDSYQNSDLQGAEVVFTVKVNYVKTEEELKPEAYYGELGFETYELYVKDAEKRAAENYLFNFLCENSEVKEYPEKDIEIIYGATENTIEMNLKKSYGMDFDTYLENVGQTQEEFKSDLVENQIKPLMENFAALYAVADKEDIKVTSEEISAKIKELIASYGSVQDTTLDEDYIKEMYGEYYFEAQLMQEKVIDFMYLNAKIK